jgi:2-oxo-4-hydroxy-4-carboxy-5-ureidoimidazoline decarboxylase
MEPWRRLDLAAPDEARAMLTGCCGSTRWVDAMLARRPYGSADDLLLAAASIWASLEEPDWREAFSHHPKIGEKRLSSLSRREQAGVAEASASTLQALEEGNRDYEAKFGYIFIVCATGLSAESMLNMLRERLRNDPAAEIRIAAGEQAKITALRLQAIQ